MQLFSKIIFNLGGIMNYIERLGVQPIQYNEHY